jgi:ACS family hexuronate transporter-like MFS transporter
MMMLCSVLSYLDRQILAVLAPTILADTGMTVEQYSRVVAAFSVGYMIGNPVWGAVLDRSGVRIGMTLAVGLWTAASASHAFLSGMVGFGIARAVLGLGEGATFPGGFRTAMDSLPQQNRSRGIALAYSGGSLGAMITPLVVTPLALAWGWRATFLLTGVLGTTWLVAWNRTVRVQSVRTLNFHFPNVLEVRFWKLVSTYALGGFPLAPILYLIPLYLTRGLGWTQAEAGRVLWIPPLGWEVGYFFWGWISDRYMVSGRKPGQLFCAMGLMGLPVLAITAVQSSAVVLLITFWTMFMAAGFVIVSVRLSALAYPKERAAMVAGIGAGSWSATVALILPWLGLLFDQKRYSAAFMFVGLVPLTGLLIWLLLNWRWPQSTAAPEETGASVRCAVADAADK